MPLSGRFASSHSLHRSFRPSFSDHSASQMDSPTSDTSTAFDFRSVPMPQTKGYRPLPSMSTEQPLVPPATYHYRRDGWFGAVRIWNVPSDQSGSKKESSLMNEDSATCNPFATCLRSIGCLAEDEFDDGDIHESGPQNIFATPPSHSIRRTGWRWYALSERPEDESGEEKRVIDFQTEPWWGTTSVYDQTDDPSRQGVMCQSGWLSIQRTLNDFEGVRYSCRTAYCSGDITVTRLSDNVVIARLSRANWRFDWGRLGVLDVVEPVSRDLLHLIISAIYIKFLVDRERERDSGSNRRRRRLEE